MKKNEKKLKRKYANNINCFINDLSLKETKKLYEIAQYFWLNSPTAEKKNNINNYGMEG